MKQPRIVIVDDDPQVLRAIQRDVRKAFKKDYKVVATHSAVEALEALEAFKKQGEEVALLLSDQRMPEMLGVDFLRQAQAFYPDAKRLLLTAYSDIEAAIRAINEVQLDYYLTKPWDPPEEKLFPVLQDQLEEWQVHYKPRFDGIKIIGLPYSPKAHLIKDFLSGNLIPYLWLEANKHPEAAELLQLHQLTLKDLPVVILEDGTLLKHPELTEVGEKVGLKSQAKAKVYDVAIIGAGPAGLAAAVYGGSEGLNTLLIERRAPGGQAGTSSRIENYLGFPKGLSGAELTQRAITQATRFGVEFLAPQQVARIEEVEGYKAIYLSNGDLIHSKAVVITTGVDYRKLEAKGVHDFTGAGVYYGAATTEASTCKGQDVYIVGGGNSAGQAAMYLAKFARKVHILIRKPDLSSSMSQYLIDQIAHTDNIEVIGRTVVVEAQGAQRLESLTIQDLDTQASRQVEAAALFVFIGARPYTDWLPDTVRKDGRGFIITGRDLLNQPDFGRNWKLNRDPLALETATPGIFAAGDVRSGAMNRVASAVGEGAMAIKLVHEYLAQS